MTIRRIQLKNCSLLVFGSAGFDRCLNKAFTEFRIGNIYLRMRKVFAINGAIVSCENTFAENHSFFIINVGNVVKLIYRNCSGYFRTYSQIANVDLLSNNLNYVVGRHAGIWYCVLFPFSNDCSIFCIMMCSQQCFWSISYKHLWIILTFIVGTQTMNVVAKLLLHLFYCITTLPSLCLRLILL